MNPPNNNIDLQNIINTNQLSFQKDVRSIYSGGNGGSGGSGKCASYKDNLNYDKHNINFGPNKGIKMEKNVYIHDVETNTIDKKINDILLKLTKNKT